MDLPELDCAKTAQTLYQALAPKAPQLGEDLRVGVAVFFYHRQTLQISSQIINRQEIAKNE